MLLSSSETVLSVRRGSSLGQQKTYQVKNKNKKFTSSDEVHSQSLSERYLTCASPVSCLITQAIDLSRLCMSRLYNLVSSFFFKKKMSYFCNCSAARHHQRHPCVYPSFRELSDCIRAICNLKKNPTLPYFCHHNHPLNFSRVSYLLRLWGDLHSLFSWYLNVSNSSVPLSTAPTLWVSRRWSYLGLS